jgi:hypothetical protein
MPPIPISDEPRATMREIAADYDRAKRRGGSLSGATSARQTKASVPPLKARPLFWWRRRFRLRGRVVSRHLIRAALAAVWLYQGLWCKLLGGSGRHAEIVASMPALGAAVAHGLLLAIGAVECALAIWTLAGVRLRAAAAAQTLSVAVRKGAILAPRWPLCLR